MTTNSEANHNNNNNNITSPSIPKDSGSQEEAIPAECCMCGDYGVSNELFQCTLCQFRSQHRYCSNLYPKSESYQVCNWCLRHQKEDQVIKSQNSSNSSSSNKTNAQEEDDDTSKNKKNNNNIIRVVKTQRSKLQQQEQQQLNKPIIKSSSQERSSPPPPPPQQPTPTPTPTRKRIMTYRALEEKRLLKRTKSELDISNNYHHNHNNNNNNTVMIRKPVYRNKVRRYKLLDEVSS